MLFTLRSGLPGTKIRMLTFSSDRDCVGGVPLLVRLARYWKQCSTNPVPRFIAMAPSFEKLLVGEPSRSCHGLLLNALEALQSLAVLVRYCRLMSIPVDVMAVVQ